MGEVAGGLEASAFRFAVRTAGGMLLAGGSLALAWAAAVAGGLGGPGARWRAAVFVAGALGAGFGAVLLVLGRRAPAWLLFAFPSLTAALICAAPLASQQSTPAGSILLAWPVLFAGYLLPERVAGSPWGSRSACWRRSRCGSTTPTPPPSCAEVGASLVATLYITVHLRRHNRALVDALQREARTDPLTGLANRRAFDELLEREFALYRRHGDPLALLAIDIDHFKRLNDRAGHPAGDAALAALAALLAAQVRRGDIVARTGGEEFAILLTDCPTETARQRARALRAVVAGDSAAWPNPITVSIGVAALPRARREPGPTALGRRRRAVRRQGRRTRQRRHRLTGHGGPRKIRTSTSRADVRGAPPPAQAGTRVVTVERSCAGRTDPRCGAQATRRRSGRGTVEPGGSYSEMRFRRVSRELLEALRSGAYSLVMPPRTGLRRMRAVCRPVTRAVGWSGSSSGSQFAAIRSYTATAAKHGLGTLDVLILAAEGRPRGPQAT